MLPEQLARQNIDNQLTQCGWLVQDRRDMNITAGPGVAVREVGLSTGETDYLLFVDGKAAGVVEAKPEGSSVTTAETQSQEYLSGLSACVPHYRLPLPFEYRSDGKTTHFTNDLDPNARSRVLCSFHRPEELLRLVRQKSQLRENLRDMPELETTGLWDVQVRAITNLEKSLGKLTEEVTPYNLGQLELRYSLIKDLARRLSIKPFHVDESEPETQLKLWHPFGAMRPDKVDSGGNHCKHSVDIVALVRHAIDSDASLLPARMDFEERFTEWLSDQQSIGGEFTDEQMQWLVAIKDHMASSLMIEQDDFEYAPFNQFVGIGHAYELFGTSLKAEMSLAS